MTMPQSESWQYTLAVCDADKDMLLLAVRVRLADSETLLEAEKLCDSLEEAVVDSLLLAVEVVLTVAVSLELALTERDLLAVALADAVALDVAEPLDE